jgi:hypothetical protein
VNEAFAIRPATPADEAGLTRLCRLDAQCPRPGRWLLCEVDDRVVAAIELEHGWVVADPFRRTAHFVALLEQRRSTDVPRPWLAARRWATS